jgi:hypothetical protein
VKKIFLSYPGSRVRQATCRFSRKIVFHCWIKLSIISIFKLIYVYSLYYSHCMVRATATVVWYRFRFIRKKEIGILLTYFNLCKRDKNHRVLYVLYLWISLSLNRDEEIWIDFSGKKCMIFSCLVWVQDSNIFHR